MSRRARVLLTLVGIAVLAQPLPANAAVPKRATDRTMTCSDGGQVKIWDSRGRSAVNNGCKSEWLQIWRSCWDCGASTDQVLNVAPGAHFNWSQKQFRLHSTDGDESVSMRLEPGPRRCTEDGPGSAVLRGSHGKTTRFNCDHE
jgi:hypothetical protein